MAFRTRVVREKTDDQFEYRMITADGHARWFRDMVTVVIEDSQVVKLRGTMVDMTAQKLRAVFAGHDLYLATKSAYNFFCEQSVEVPEPFEIPDFRTVSHDLLVTDMRFLFERIGFGTSWTSERVWRMGSPASKWAPDAVIHIGGDPVALEVECVRKTDARYHDIFWRYNYNQSIAGCLYVTEKNLLNALLERAKDFDDIWFTSTAELFEKKEKAEFRNAKGRILAIEDNLEKNLSKSGQPQ